VFSFCQKRYPETTDKRPTAKTRQLIFLDNDLVDSSSGRSLLSKQVTVMDGSSPRAIRSLRNTAGLFCLNCVTLPSTWSAEKGIAIFLMFGVIWPAVLIAACHSSSNIKALISPMTSPPSYVLPKTGIPAIARSKAAITKSSTTVSVPR
jgi:hypothetical protein